VLQFFIVLGCLPFLALLTGQTFLGFEFLRASGFSKLRRSAYVETVLLLFALTNEVSFNWAPRSSHLIVANVASGLLLILFYFTDEYLDEQAKRVELSFLMVNSVGVALVDFSFLLGYGISLYLWFIGTLFVVATVLHVSTYSLEFEVQNINKWPTSELMVRYTDNLRLFLNRREEYGFHAAIAGYMEMHRHKCDIEGCPSRGPLNDHEQRMLDSGEIQPEDEDLLRCENVIKKIYKDGERETPISSRLLLENAIFLYEKGEKELALKTLLQIVGSSISLDIYYRFVTLREKIHLEMKETPGILFLDLVSELRVKYEEEEIVKKMERAALVNLEFWSVLNEDHPDFQKLNEVATARIEIRNAITHSYEFICSVASNEKVTSLYVSYLEAIENDEDLYNSILSNLQEQFRLEERVLLQDWANTSHPIMVVSIEAASHGTIIGINSSCALLLGYEKYEILNNSIKLLLPGELGHDAKQFLDQNHIAETYFVAHKSGYLLKVLVRSQNYNSMETGLATIIHMSCELLETTCLIAVDNLSDKLLGVTSSFVSFLGIDQKLFEEKVAVEDFFQFSFAEIKGFSDGKGKPHWELKDLVASRYAQELEGGLGPFRLSVEQHENCRTISLQQLKSHKKRLRTTLDVQPVEFEFQIQATLSTFKYFGCHHSHESYLSQFSQFSFAETLKQGMTMRNFAQGIGTLRLRNNIIQVIEENENDEVDGMKRSDSQLTGQGELIPQKEEEEIFRSRSSFMAFIESHSFARYILWIMLVGKAILVGSFVVSYVVMTDHHYQVGSLTTQIVYNNLITGEVAKQYSLLQSIQMMEQGLFSQNVEVFIHLYEKNIALLQEFNQHEGSQYNISINMGAINVSFISSEFYLSFLDNTKTIYSAIGTTTTQAQLLQSLGPSQQSAISYLKTNCPIAASIMIDHSHSLQQTTQQIIQQFISQ
jgi:hypothetical protein